MRIKRFLLGLSILFSLTLVAWAGSNQWLHIRVEKAGKSGENIKINVPLSLVETVLPMLEQKDFKGGKIRLPHQGMTVEDLREIWQSLRAQGDAEFVRVEKADQDLRVFIEGAYLYVKSSENSKKQVDVEIPVQVVDAMFSGQGDELNLAAAIRALQESGAREIISVKSEEESVRVWIDESK